MANTKITAANIDSTSTGFTLADLTVNGDITGTLATAAQPNITSVGTLTGLTSSGAIVSTSNSNSFGGTSFNNADLSSVGTIYATQYLANGDTDTGIVMQGSNVMSLHTGNSERMRIDASGNVGIGTTSPSHDLTIQKSGQDNYIRIGSNSDGYDAGVYFGTNADWSIGIDNSNSNAFSIASGSTVGTNPRLTIDSSGNVGIGVTNPDSYDSRAEKLVVGETGDAGITIAGGASSDCRLVFAVTNQTDLSNGSITYDQSADSMAFETAGSERMRILSGGTLLVSTTTASGLSNGTTNYGHSFGGGQQVNATNNDTNLILNMSNGSSNPHVQFRSDGGNTGSISTNGSAVSFNTGSDYRLKENVDYDFNALDRVAQLKPARFNFIVDADTTVDGFIAHEVQDIVPEAVTGEKDAEEMQCIDQSKLVPLLTKAIQEQQTIIDDLKSRIEALER